MLPIAKFTNDFLVSFEHQFYDVFRMELIKKKIHTADSCADDSEQADTLPTLTSMRESMYKYMRISNNKSIARV